MLNLPFSDDAIWNIIGHIQASWTHAKLNPIAIEDAVATALRPFYESTEHLGPNGGFVDVKAGHNAFDIKCRKTLTIKDNMSRYRPNFDTYSYLEHKSPHAFIRVPKETSTMVRRPCFDLENFKGDPEYHLKSQLQEYQDFAAYCVESAGCTDIWSMVVQYGILNAVRTIYMSICPFSVPTLVQYHATPGSYVGRDARGKNVFSIVRMNNGSVNTCKMFSTTQGVSAIWNKEVEPPVLYTKDEIAINSTVNIIS